MGQGANIDTIYERIEKIPQTGIFRQFGCIRAQRLYLLESNVEKDIKNFNDSVQRFQQSNVHLADAWSPDWRRLAALQDEDITKAMLAVMQSVKVHGDAVIQDAAVAGLSEPHQHFMEDFRDCLNLSGTGVFGPTGGNATIYGKRGDPINPDLRALKLFPSLDGLSYVLYKIWGSLSVRISRSENPRYNMKGFTLESLHQLAYLTSCVLLTILYSTSITILYSVKSMKARLGIIPALLLVFSLISLFLSKSQSSRSELMIIISAYAAIMVVFVSNSTVH